MCGWPPFARQDSWRGLAWRRADRYPELLDRALAALGRWGSPTRRDSRRARSPTASRRQLELAIALAAAPRLLLLDEPAAGLSPDETQKMVGLVRKLKGRYTIVLIEHKIGVVMSMSDRISVMHFGSVIAEGTPAEIQPQRGSPARLPGGIAPP